MAPWHGATIQVHKGATMETVSRKLAAILSADVAGYSRLMAEDHEATLATLTSHRDLFSRNVQQHQGRVVNAPGDAILAEFASVVDAVACAAEIQRELAEKNAELPGHRRMEFRIGVNLGDVLVKEGDLFGDGVNIAARLQALADPGGICVSGTAFDQVEGRLPLEYASLGEQHVKNIPNPVRAYKVLSRPGAAAHRVVKARQALGRHWRRWAIGGAVTAALIGMGAAGAWWWTVREVPITSTDSTALPLPDKPSIAVLPFTNMSGDPEQEYFSDGITEDIITGLTRFTKLYVVARNSTFAYKGKATDVRTIGKELAARFVLEGSVRRFGDRVRVTAQLIDAATGAHLWAEQYDRELKDLFAAQDDITGQIVGRLDVEVDRAELERSKRASPKDFGAYDLVLQARPLIQNSSQANHAQARDLLENAIMLDGEYAAAYTELAWVYLDEYRFGWNMRPDPLDRALVAARRGVELGPNDGIAHWRLAKVLLFRKDLTPFESKMKQALALNPNHAEMLADISVHLGFLDRLDESYQYYQQAIRLDPHFVPWVRFASWNYFYRKNQYEMALAEALQIRLAGFVWAPWARAVTYAQLGQLNKAHWEAAEVLKLKPDFAFWDDGEPFNFSKVRMEHLAEGNEKAGLPLHRSESKPPKP
jgi:adenylate cyclase